MFGKVTKDGRKGGLPLSRDVLDHHEPESDAGWMPPRHKKGHIPTHNGQETIPPSLREAICAFVLACAARELRGQGDQHSSMLIHVTRYVDVQKHVREQVEEAVRRMRQKIKRRIDADELLAQLRKLWDEDFLPVRDQVAELSPAEERPPAMPGWDEIVALLPDVLDDIEVRSINGTAKDALDYATPGAALKVIAIGALAGPDAGGPVCQLLRAHHEDVRHADADGTLVRLSRRLSRLVPSVHLARSGEVVRPHRRRIGGAAGGVRLHGRGQADAGAIWPQGDVA
jgi:hypothetical protein